MVLLMLLPRWSKMFLFQFICFTMINHAGKVKGLFKGREIIFSNFTDVARFRFGSDNSNSSQLLGGLEGVRSIAYDYRERHLFYELETTIIKRTNLDHSNGSDIVVEATLENHVYGMAVDWVTHKLYFTNEETNHVSVSRYDGQYRRVLVSRGLDQPRGIAVLPQKGYMFVTDWGDYPKIERFNMDGTEGKVIVKTDIRWPFCITVDMATNLVFWGDTYHMKIEYMTVNGTNRSVIKLAKENPIQHLTAFDNELFWSDAKAKIYSVHKDFPNDVESFDRVGGKHIVPYGLEIYTEEKQPWFSSGCHVDNGGCSHLCLLTPTGHTCACPTGIAQKDDGKTCEDGMKQFLLIARKMDIRLMSLDADTDVDVILPIKGIEHCIGVEYDLKSKKVYWADKNTESISRAFLNGSGFEQVISYDMKYPDHLAIDWIARNMYWTESELNRIEVASIDKPARKIIISEGLQQPRGIVVDPADGKIYWTDWGNESKIEAADLDGENREVLVNKDLIWPNGITLDYMNHKLYWVDAKFHSVNSFDLDTRKMHTVFTEARHPFGITMLSHHLYWTDWHRHVTRYDLEDGKAERILEGISDVMGIKGVNTEPAYGMNDCHHEKNNCTHFCFHKPVKGIVCACPTRMELKNDRKTCKMPSGFLLYSISVGIMKMSIDTYKDPDKIPLSNANSASLMDTHYELGRIFWLEDSPPHSPIPPSINWAFLNGSGYERLVVAGLTKVEGLAVDWMANNLYWIHNNNLIEMAKVDGKYRRVLSYSTSGVVLKFLQVNPHVSKMFWFQTNEVNLSLWEANLDATERKQLISIPKVYAKSCTIDYQTGTIYWIQENLGKESIQGYQYSSGKLTTVKDNLAYIRGLLFFGGSLYYSDQQEELMKKFSVENPRMRKGEQVLVKLEDMNWVLDIKAFHGSVQKVSNACSHRNGGCQHLCIVKSRRHHECACATHYTLNTDNLTCTPHKHFMLLHQHNTNTISRILLDNNNNKKKQEFPFPLPVIHTDGKVRRIEYDVVRDFFYWLEEDINVGGKKRLMRYSPNGKTVVVPMPTKTPYDFALDPYSNTVFLTDAKENNIKFLHLNTTRNGTVVRQNDVKTTESYYPRRICVFPELGRIFWISERPDRAGRILSSTLAGSDTKRLKSFKFPIIDLKLDYLSERIYWLEAGRESIFSMSVHGDHESRYEGMKVSAPKSLAIFGNVVYWADQSFMRTPLSQDKRDYPVYSMKTNVSSDGELFQTLTSAVSNLLVVNMTRRNESHPCVVLNGGCSHICSIDYRVELDPNKKTPQAMCSCPLGMELIEGKTCKDKVGCSDSSQFYCAPDSRCYDAKVVCNKHYDCPDRSDESECEYIGPPCSASVDLIKCGVGCIHKDRQCDGKVDCPSGEDEQNCLPCDAHYLQCDNRCLIKNKICDGKIDCSDGKDEPKNCCPPGKQGKGCKRVNSTIPTTTKVHEKKRMVAGIISGVIICVIVIMFTFLLWFKLCNSKKNAARDHHVNGAVWSLAQLSHNNTESMTSDDKTSHAKSSVSTYISAVSQNTEPSFYDRNNVTGASSTTALSGYSHLPYNPPPSPMTQRALSTITESNGPYGYSSCEHCRSTIKEVPLSEIDHNDPPPTLASTLLLEDVDMYLPLQQKQHKQPSQQSQNNGWESTSCNTCQTNKCSRASKSRRSNHISNNHNNRRGSSYINNFSAYEHNEQSISEMEPLQDSWIYGSEDVSIQPRFDTNPSNFIDVSQHRFFCLDPPPTPCTNYMSQDDVRPPSPTDTEVSLAYRLINNVDASLNYAPPPSPTSQL